MIVGASTLADAMGGWAQGCLVLLIGFWLLLALLGVRNSRFPLRILGGAAFLVGSALWIGLHPALAEAWHLDAGHIGWWAESAIAQPLAGSAFALSGLAALLLLCSLVGFLVAIDWLPLAPLRPALLRLAERLDAREAALPQPGSAAARPTISTLHRIGTAAAQARESKARPVGAAPPARPAPQPPAPAASVAVVAPAEPNVAPAAPGVRAEIAPDEKPAPTDWARFRPRPAAAIEPPLPADLAMDNVEAATHNSSTPEGESRASDGAADAPAGAAVVPPPSEPEAKDAPLLDRGLDDESLPDPEATDSATALEESDPVAVVDEEALEAASPPASPAPPADEELAPRRKKEEEPAKDPDEEEGDEEDEKGDDEDKEWDEDEEEGEDDEDLDDEEDDDFEDEDEDEEEEEDEDEGDEDEDEDDAEEKDEEEEDEDEDDWNDEEEEEEEGDEDEEKVKDGESGPVSAPALQSPVALEVPLPAVEPPPPDGSSAPAELPAHLFADAAPDERALLARAVELILALESVSLSKLQRELGITYYAAARVFERLEKEGCIAAYSGSLARPVRLTREQWEERRRAP